MIGNIIAGSLSVGAPPPFVPTDISNLYLWLDADDASTFTYSSGSVISQWNDKSGNGYHATQATVAKQPSRVTSPSIGVDFDGSNDVLSTTASFNVSVFTQFNVVRDFDGASGDVLFGAGSGGSEIYFPYVTGSEYYFQINSAYGIANLTQPTGLYELETRYNGAGSTNADKMKARIGGSDRTLTFTGTMPTSLSRSGQTTAIGAYNFTPVLPFNGILSESITYNKVLDNTELTNVRNYLSAKWGITA